MVYDGRARILEIRMDGEGAEDDEADDHFKADTKFSSKACER